MSRPTLDTDKFFESSVSLESDSGAPSEEAGIHVPTITIDQTPLICQRIDSPLLKPKPSATSITGAPLARTSTMTAPKRPPAAALNILDMRPQAAQHLEAARWALEILKASKKTKSSVCVGGVGLRRIEHKAVSRVRYQ